jgi:membrane fusion protein (multidrug efflux system)
VKVGSARDGQWVILGGLEPGEQVMVDGFQKLRGGKGPVKPVPWQPGGPGAPGGAPTPAGGPAAGGPTAAGAPKAPAAPAAR